MSAPPQQPRGFATLWASTVGSNLADGLLQICVPLLALQLTDDPFLVSALSAVGFLPWLLFSVLSGAVVDRSDRRLVLAVAQLARVGVVAVLATLVATGAVGLWVLFAAVFVHASLETLVDNSASAMIPAVVPADRLDGANGRIEAGQLVAQNFVAAPIGAALFTAAAAMPLGISTVLFAGSGALALALPRAAAGRARGSDRAGVEPVATQIRQGARFLFRHAALRSLWAASVICAVALAFAQAVLAVYLLRGLGLPEAALGLFTGCAAVGGVIGAMVAGPVLRVGWSRGRVMSAAVVVAGLGLVAAGAVPATVLGLVVAALAFAVTVAAVSVWNVLAGSVRQRLVPAEMLGRVSGLWRTVLWGIQPVATLLGGLVGRWELRAPLLIGGAVLVAWALAFRGLLRPLDALPAVDASAAATPVADPPTAGSPAGIPPATGLTPGVAPPTGPAR